MTRVAAGRAGLLLGVVLLVFATNLQGVLLPIRGHEHGAGMAAIGFYSSAWSAGFVLACFLSGVLLGRAGHVRAFALLAATSALAALLFATLVDDPAWITLRGVSGFCFGGASVVLESWFLLGSQGGAAFAAYMVANLCASLAGTLSLDAVDPAGAAPFALAAFALVLSPLPVALGGRVVPPPPPIPFRPRLRLLVGRSPEAALLCVVAGGVTGALGGLAPLFGTMRGLGMGGTTLMLAANSVGGALAYVLLAFVGRRGVPVPPALLAVGGVALSLPIALMPDELGPEALIALFGVLGVVQYPLYGLAIGRASTEAPERPTTEIASEALLLFGIGTIAGPIAASQVMRVADANLFGLVAALFAVAVLVSGVRRRPPPSRVGTVLEPAGSV